MNSLYIQLDKIERDDEDIFLTCHIIKLDSLEKKSGLRSICTTHNDSGCKQPHKSGFLGPRRL